jgi:hypothetical protein
MTRVRFAHYLKPAIKPASDLSSQQVIHRASKRSIEPASDPSSQQAIH